MIKWTFHCVCAGALLLFQNSRSHAGSRLFEGSVVDDATGQAVAARVAITNAHGKFVEIRGDHAHVEYLGKRWCYVNGRFSVEVPDAGTRIEIRRGFETLPLEGPLPWLPAGGGATFRLHRWINLSEQGWLNGDIHAHLPVPREARLEMEAEDLNAQTLLHLDGEQFASPAELCVTGKLDTNSAPGREIVVAQEVQDFQMGHLTLLGITNLVSGYPEAGGGMEFWTNRPHWDLTRAMRQVRAQNGAVFWSHICSLPGEELPAGIASGLVDGVELITWSDPTMLPNHWDPWLNSGLSQAEFPVMRALDLYYVFLNAGFRLPIAAGTDKFYEEIPLGSNRAYVRTKDPGNYAAWLEGLRAGRTFVSNGPLLDFEVEGCQLGDVVAFHGSRTVKARIVARSILPFNTVDIVMNGRAVAHRSVAVPNNPPTNGVYFLAVETRVTFERSGWLAARVVDNPDLRNPILPRGASVFAHTAPIYFLRDGEKVREQASIDYLQKYVEGSLHWLSTKPAFYDEADREQAQRAAEDALKFYQKL